MEKWYQVQIPPLTYGIRQRILMNHLNCQSIIMMMPQKLQPFVFNLDYRAQLQSMQQV